MPITFVRRVICFTLAVPFAAPLFAADEAAKPVLRAGLSGEEAAKAMTVPETFTVTLAAAEPDVVQPIAMALDDRGRVWVAEAYAYPRRVPESEAKDRILVFEDVDGDGKFDKRTIFAEKLNLVSGLEVGFGGVWVGAAPHLLFIPDKDGDDKADGLPQVLLDGFGYQDTHETLNSFIWGPDGWLYGCHGVFTHSRVGKPGCKDDERVPMNAAVWRYHPVRHTFEIFAEGGSNQWGLDFNDMGHAFMTACVIPHLYHVIQGGRYQRQGGQHFNRYTYDDIKTIAKHRHFVGGQWTAADREKSMAIGGGHAHAGAMIYLGGTWPEKYRNQIFMHNIHGSRVNQDLLTRKGSGYEGSAAPDFLHANDAWSQMLSFRYGPDGQVWMIDWYDKNQCHHGNVNGHDRTNGRIFKVSYGDKKAKPVDLTKLDDSGLIKQTFSDNEWHARHARRILQERFAAGKVHHQIRVNLLAPFSFNVQHPTWTPAQDLRMLWLLNITGGVREAEALPWLATKNEYTRAWIVQLLCENGEVGEETLAKFKELAASDPSPVVRLYLASALQRLPLEKRWDVAMELVKHQEDAGDHNLPLMYWYAIEPLVAADKKKALQLAGASKIPLLRQYITRRSLEPAKPAPPPGGKVAGALEGESLKVLEISGGKAAPQGMAPFTLDHWSGTEQLWWTGAKPGDKLTLALPVAKEGKYDFTIVLSKAVDYAIVQLHFDGKKLGDPIDCYNDGVITTGPLKLGSLDLTKGEHQLTFEIVGANAKAAKAYMVGVDYVKLTAGK